VWTTAPSKSASSTPLDSWRHLIWKKLASYLPDYSILRQQMKHLTEAQIQLITRKCVFPYDYWDSWEKLDETALPTKDKFRSPLTGNEINDAEYAPALEVWRRLDITNLMEYAALYMQGDVLLLADVSENFRTTCLDAYNLDPAWYYTPPGLAWDAMLKLTDVRLVLLKDIDMHLLFERGIRGGLSQCSVR